VVLVNQMIPHALSRVALRELQANLLRLDSHGSLEVDVLQPVLVEKGVASSRTSGDHQRPR
jgi:hypothetical protein